MDAKFPTYKREQKLNVKLTTDQVTQLRADYKSKKFPTKSALAREYGISLPAVNYWLKSDDERKEASERRNKYKRTYSLDTQRRYLDRKREFDAEGVKEYRKEIKRRSQEKVNNRRNNENNSN